jgi:hypothetical protein
VNTFKTIEFGYASAEKESARSPDLLINGYVDFEDAYKKAVDGDEYLFLGYKGSGKTAIGKRLQLETVRNHNLFCKLVFIGDFPFTSFSKMIKGTPEPEARFPTAWAWLLLIYVLQSLDEDQAMSNDDPELWSRSVGALKQAGMLGSVDISSLVKRTTKRGFRVGIPKVMEMERSVEMGAEGDVSVYVEALKDLLGRVVTPNKHIIVIDGLDDIITKRETQFTSIGSLILEVGRLNEFFFEKGLNVKIIVLCRTDLFERTSNANKNKARQDYAVELDWYHDPREPASSMLMRIANTRAGLSLKRPVDLFSEFFPREVDRSTSSTYCLEMTLIPRETFSSC